MRKSLMVSGMLALAVWAFPSTAAAVSCPATLGSGGDARQYTLETSSSCVYGEGNIGGTNDAFLGDTTGQNSVTGAVGTNFYDPTTWVVSNNSLTGPVNGTSSGTWTINASANEEYGIGLKDGGSPKWAVFLISAIAAPGTISGTWSITGGGLDALSHFLLYERPGTPPPVVTPVTQPQEPGAEPTLLLLLGAGLAVASRRFRRATA